MELSLNIAELQVLSENFINLATKKMSGNEYKVMLLLKIYGVCSPRILISKIGILKTNLALVLKKLIQDDLVEVKKSMQDGRGKQYNLTKAGDELISNILNNITISLNDSRTEEFFNAVKIVLSVLNKKL